MRRMSDIVPRTATEEAWNHVRNEDVDNSVRRDSGVPRLQEHRREEWSKPLQNEMSTTREGKIKLDEEQKRRDAVTTRRMMSTPHAPVARSPGNRLEHERRAQPSKTARIASETDSSNSTVMRDVTTQGQPGADTMSKTTMRDSSKRQADVGVEKD